MLTDNIIRFWGQASLVRWPRDVVAGTRLPNESKVFLTDVGLPTGVDWTMRFGPVSNAIPRLDRHPGYCVIGYDYEAPICLDEEHEGRVVSDPDGYERFTNTSVGLFGECLVLYQQYRLAARGRGEESVQGVITKTARQMAALDPPAFASPECFWAVIIEQMKAGLL